MVWPKTNNNNKKKIIESESSMCGCHGVREEGVGSHCVTEIQLGEMNIVLEMGGSTTWMCLIPLSLCLKMVKMVNMVFCVFYN